MKKMPTFQQLITPFEERMGSIPFSEYPRPAMKRDSYICLNGEWDFKVTHKDTEKYSGSIRVPFPPESRLSGVMTDIGKKDVMIYERHFSINECIDGKRVLLHLDAVDQSCLVYVNGLFAGLGRDGYLPVTIEITPFLDGVENVLRVEARDPLDKDYPYGKQTDKRGGMWYTKVSGIWQSVWLEIVPDVYVEEMRLTPTLDSVSFNINGGEAEKHVTVVTPDGDVSFSFTGDDYTFNVPSPRLWSPEDPYLYYFTLTCGEDRIESYFALRTFGVTEVGGVSYLSLNGKPYFLHGLLDQGYFSDGIFLPATPEGYLSDILKMKECGFNMLRKHIKTEPQIFYHYCDKYGMIVFQDMVNNGPYSFIRDTALPTVGIRRGIRQFASENRRNVFLRTSMGIQNMLYNHPSVCYYTIFNEGWGQFDPDACYHILKAMDQTRVYDTTSGWFKTRHTDVESDHVYFKAVKLRRVKGRPMVLSEFGGYSCKLSEHSFNLDKTYGYRFFDCIEKFENALVELYENEIIPHIRKGLSATVLTQVSDVEDETNGLLTYDRQVLKVDAKRMKALAEKMYSLFAELTGEVK